MGPTARPPDDRAARSPGLALALLIYLALGVVMLAGALQGWDRIGGKDWGWFLGQTQAEVSSLRDWSQFPHWMPWRRGGQVGYAQPESMFLSAVTPLALLVGALAAFKLLLLPLHLCGCLGLHKLAEALGLSGWARLVPSLLFFGSSVFPLYAVGGLPNWLFALAIVPWLLFALQRSLADARWALLAGLLWAGLLWCGALFQFVFLPPFLAVWMLALALRRRSPRPLLLLGASLLAGFCLAAPRLLPVFDVYEQFPRLLDEVPDFLTLPMAWRAWVDPHLPPLDGRVGPLLVLRETAVWWIYVGGYVGPAALLLAAAGLFAGRAVLAPLAAGAAFLWLALGAAATPNLWKALHALPVYDSMHWPQRLSMLATFCLALLAGFGWQVIEAGLARLAPRGGGGRFVPAARAVLLAALVAPLLAVNAPIASHAFPVEPDRQLQRAASFHQAREDEAPQNEEQFGGNLYESVLANVGCPDATSSIPSPPVVVREGDPGYRGEVFLLGGHGAVRALLTPSVIDVEVQLDAADTLVVNQNYAPGWRAEGSLQAPLADRGGLLSLPLAAGHHRLTLAYASASVPRGFAIGGAALLLGAGYLLARRRRAVTSAAGPEFVVLAGFLGLAVAQGLPSLPDHVARPLSPEEAVLATALVVDGSLAPAAGAPGGRTFRTIQAAIDAAPDGGYVRVRPGTYDGFRLGKPLFLATCPAGRVVVRSVIEITGIPAGRRAGLAGLSDRLLQLDGGLSVHDCAGGVVVQYASIGGGADLGGAAEGGAPGGFPPTRVTLTANVSLSVERSARVLLAGCSVLPAAAAGGRAAVVVEGGGLVAAHGRIAAAAGSAPGEPGAAGIDARDAVVLLADTTVRGGDGGPAGGLADGTVAAGAGGPALRLKDSRAVLSAAPEVVIEGGLPGPGGDARGGARTPAIDADSGSRALVSGAALGKPASPPAVVAEVGVLVRALPELPRVRVVQSRFQDCTLLISLDGPPLARGLLLVGTETALVPVFGDLGLLQIDRSAPSGTVQVQFPAGGRLELRVRVPPALLRPGAGAFCQVIAEREAGAGVPAVSIVDGELFEFRER